VFPFFPLITRHFSNTFRPGRFCRKIAHACLSFSTCANASNPAISSPSACPPAPEPISMQVGAVEGIGFRFMGSFEKFRVRLPSSETALGKLGLAEINLSTLPGYSAELEASIIA